MKFVQYAIAMFAATSIVACGADSTTDVDPKCDADSTFAQVQQQIFEGRGCTASACHGESKQGGLDLRPANAYASLVNVPATSGDYVRVFPAEEDVSLLYQKVAGSHHCARLEGDVLHFSFQLGGHHYTLNRLEGSHGSQQGLP